jgi:heterodisulfide reductase subunit A
LLAGGSVELDPFVAHVDAVRCIGDGACLDECPCSGALTMEEYDDGTRKAVVNAAICTGCGACVAVCPTRAIDLNGWSLDSYEAMVDAFLASRAEVPGS